MKHLSGKKIEITCVSGYKVAGLCTGATDEIVKLMIDGDTDETIIFVKNIFSYVIIGGGVTGGYSGIKVYVCRCENINCLGRIKLSAKKLILSDMECPIVHTKTVAGSGYDCDFGCVGAMEVIPSNVQKMLFEGMMIIRKENNDESTIRADKKKIGGDKD